MNTFDRIYEALLLNPYDRAALNELWSLLRSPNADVRQAADETLSNLIQHGYLKVERVS